MNVSVTPELEALVHTLVASGRFSSASEVFRAGLRLLEQAERRRQLESWLMGETSPEEDQQIPTALRDDLRARLQAKIDEGLDALERGDVVDGEAFFADWSARLKRMKETHHETPAQGRS